MNTDGGELPASSLPTSTDRECVAVVSFLRYAPVPKVTIPIVRSRLNIEVLIAVGKWDQLLSFLSPEPNLSGLLNREQYLIGSNDRYRQ